MNRVKTVITDEIPDLQKTIRLLNEVGKYDSRGILDTAIEILNRESLPQFFTTIAYHMAWGDEYLLRKKDPPTEADRLRVYNALVLLLENIPRYCITHGLTPYYYHYRFDQAANNNIVLVLSPKGFVS